MQIHNLPERSAIADADVYAVDTGTTTGKTPFSLMKSLIKTFTLQFSDLTLKTTASNNDVFAIDDGTGSKKMRFSELKNQVVEKATPGYNSGDSETVDATSWTDVAKVTSGLTFTTTLNRITTMMKNVRYLFNILGTTDISGSGKSTVTEAIGGEDISGLSSDGTITAALARLNTDIAVTDYTSSVSLAENANVFRCYKAGAIVTGTFQGENKARAENQLLFTLPSAVRPRSPWYTMAYVSGVPLILRIDSATGQCILYVSSSYPSGRVYFDYTFLV